MDMACFPPKSAATGYVIYEGIMYFILKHSGWFVIDVVDAKSGTVRMQAPDGWPLQS